MINPRRKREAEPPDYMWIALDDMYIDAAYQRPLDEHRVDQMVKAYEISQLDAPVVNYRPTAEGTYSVVNGQHRIAMARKLGLTGMWCKVLKVSRQEEARLFERGQNNSKRLEPYWTHRALVVYGDQRAVAIDNTVRVNGLRVANRLSADNDIKCITALGRIYDSYGAEHLDHTLRFIRETWDDDRQVRTSEVVGGVSLFLHAHDEFPDDAFAKRLDRYSGKKIIKQSNEYSTMLTNTSNRQKAVARALEDLYNRGLSDESKIRISKKFPI